MGHPRIASALAALLVTALVACTPADVGAPEELGGGTVTLDVVEGPGGLTLAFVPVRVEGRGPFRFALDTGASQSLVDRQIARRSDLPIVGRGRPVVGVAGATRVDLARIEAWRAGAVQLPSSTAAILDLQAPRRGERSARGLLGSDVLSRFGVVTVDYDRGRLTLGREEAPPRRGWRSVELRVLRGAAGSVLAFVTVRIGGEEVPFAVDTGASSSAVSADVARRLGLEIVDRGQPLMGIAGVGRADVARVERWRVGQVRLPRMRIAVLDLPRPPPGAVGPTVKGLLGSDVLSRFGAIAIDYGEEELALRPRG